MTNNKNLGEVQVAGNHYLTEKYLGVERFLSLHSQFRLCMEGSPDDTYLEIGPGPGLLVGLLKQFGRNITTVDLAEDLNPDHIEALPSLSFSDKSFDIVCAFEVLEHIPWDMLSTCAEELGRIARKQILLSLPNQSNLFNKSVSVKISFGKLHLERLFWKKPLNRITNPSEHYWEIGHNGIKVETVLAVFERSGFNNIQTFFVEPWFQFFVIDI
jgi:hypothetical protein